MKSASGMSAAHISLGCNMDFQKEVLRKWSETDADLLKMKDSCDLDSLFEYGLEVTKGNRTSCGEPYSKFLITSGGPRVLMKFFANEGFLYRVEFHYGMGWQSGQTDITKCDSAQYVYDNLITE